MGATSFLKTSFTAKAAMDGELVARLRDEMKLREFFGTQQERVKRIEAEQRADAEDRLFAYMAVAATEAQIMDFTARLDVYDTASVEALLANEKELRDVRERIEKNLSQATQLPDGRRVFKSEDGTKVFDEFGTEISSEEFSPDLIPDYKRRFEPHWRDVEQAEDLTQERQQIHDFQSQLDDAHEKVKNGDITQDELKDLQDDIDAAAPERIRALVADKIDLAPAKAGSEQDGAAPDDLDIPAIGRRSVNPAPAGP